jgi:hypothetical protein
MHDPIGRSILAAFYVHVSLQHSQVAVTYP